MGQRRGAAWLYTRTVLIILSVAALVWLPSPATAENSTLSAFEALGLIETRGLVALVEAADAMLKAGDVSLFGWQSLGAGLVTASIGGDVAAVKASVDAGAAAAGRIGEVVGVQVILRPHADLAPLLPKRTLRNTESLDQAVGLLETKGFIAAVAGGDAMLKAALVTLQGRIQIGDGLVTLFILGDVGSVRAAIDAGAQAASQSGELISAHVIPRPEEAVLRVFRPE